MSGIIPIEIASGVPVVDSRTIAEMCNVQHESLYRLLAEYTTTIEEAFGGVRFEIGASQTAGGRQQVKFALLTEDQATFLITLTRNTEPVVKFKAALVKAFSEAKRKLADQSPAIPQSLPEALRAYANEVERNERLALENASMKPKAEFVDRYVDATGNKGFREVCKLLKANEDRFREFLTVEKVMYKLGGEWMPYQNHIDADRFAVKAGVSKTSEHAYNHAKFTPKGVEWIAGLWGVYKLRETHESRA